MSVNVQQQASEPGPGRAAEIYLGAMRRHIIPVLSLMDREWGSPTRGCLDRTYWAWKFTDFPGARFQEGLAILAFFYQTPMPDNPYYQSQEMLAWLAAGFDFWSEIQYSDGSFDEAYPFERSLAATAFSAFYLSEAWYLVGASLPTATAVRFKQSLTRAADWLVKNDETHGFLSNHLAAAAGALFHAHKILGHKRFYDRGYYFVNKILAHQSDEGWYEEYGGADPGYQTHGSFYLARCWQLLGDQLILKSLQRSLVFMAQFVHPDGSLGGEYASRNTQTYYPAAFEMLAVESETARWIATEMLTSVQDLSAAGLGTVDIYNLFPLLNNYLFAYIASGQQAEESPPAASPQADGLLVYEEAGIIKFRAPDFDLFVATKKGGVVKLFDRRNKELAHSDCGYLGLLENGQTLTTQWHDTATNVTIAEDCITIDAAFHKLSRPIMKPLRFWLFRGFSLTVGRLPGVSYWLKSLLVKALIYRSRALPLRLNREISFSDNGVSIADRLEGHPGQKIKALYWCSRFSTIHMGSSRYFIPNELAETEGGSYEQVDLDRLAIGVVRQKTIAVAAAKLGQE